MDTPVIVGAGPTGLTLACDLAQHGVTARIIDKATGPATTSRANILHARGAEVLDRAGALGDLPQRAEPGLTMRPSMGGKPFTIRFGNVDGTPVRALYISQAEVESQLRRRLTELGGRVEWGLGLAAAVPRDSHADLTLSDGTTTNTPWLIGCDGSASVVRAQGGFSFPGETISEKFLLADLYLDDWYDRDGGFGWYHRDGMLVAMPMPSTHGNLWRFMAYIPEGSEERLDADAIIARFIRIIPQRSGLPEPRVRGAEWTSVFRIRRRLAEQYRRGRILLAGDAAHLHSPFGGQGMLTGIGDAENLAWKLALVLQGRAGEPLLDTYGAERRPLAVEVLKETSRGTWLQTGESPLARAILRFIVMPLMSTSAVQTRLTLAASQLAVSYRHGPLGASGGPKPRPGDRVPNLSCRAPDGTRTRLHRELRGHWALLTSGGAVDSRAVQRLGDVSVLLGDVPDGQMWLVRPDGHLAWRGRDGLETWLDGALRHGKAPR